MNAPYYVPDGSEPHPFPYEWADNWAAVVGVIICIALLWLWGDRNAITLNKGKRDWEDE